MPNFCIRYKNDFKYFDKLAEAEVSYANKPWMIPTLLAKYPHITFIIFCPEEQLTEQNFKKIAQWKEDGYTNFKLKLPLSATKNIMELQHLGLPFFFNHYCLDIDTVAGMVNMGVSDIYLTNTLCFNLKELSKYIHSKNIKIRVCPNIAQSSWTECRTISSFFIRPEDVNIYSEYIDVFEFVDPKRQNILFEIYAIDKEWNGGLNEIVNGLRDCTIICNSIPNIFAVKRINCQKRCGYGKCNFCNQMADFATTLKEKGYMLS